MSGPNPPEPDSGAEDVGNVPSASGADSTAAGDGIPEIDELEVAAPAAAPDNTAYSQAYSAPESDQFLSGPYVPVDPRLYDYDDYGGADEPDPHAKTPRWPWVVGITVIIAAVSLVVSVALLFAHTENHDVAAPVTTTSAPPVPPVQDEITKTSTPTTTTAPPPPPSSSEEPAPEPSTTTQEPTTSSQAKPLQITYSVTGTKAPFDSITITFVDATGQRRVQRNAYIPWSMTLTPISQSEVGSVEVTSMLRLSKLNCTITSSDGRVLFANTNDAPAASCG